MGPRAQRWLKRGLLGTAAAPFVLATLVLGALALPFTRAPIVRKALDLTNNSLGGIRIELDQVDRLDLWGIDLRGVRVFDEQRREIVSVQSASLRMAPLSLFSNTLRLTAVSVSGTRVRLYPAQAEPEEEEPEAAPSTFQILAERVRVSDAALDMQLSGRALHVKVQVLSAAGAYGRRTAATIHEAALFADVDARRALNLRTTRASWDERKGGKVGLVGDVLDAHVEIAASVPALDAKASWPIEEASLTLSGLTAEGLSRVGLADAAQLHVPIDLNASARVRGERLEAELVLSAGQAKLTLNAAAAPRLYSLRAQLRPTLLSAVSGVLPALLVGFDLHAEARPDLTPMPIELEWRDLSLDGRAVPQGALSAALALPEIELKRLGLHGLEQALRLRGKYDIERAAGELAFESSELALSALGGLVPAGLHGTLNGGIDARLSGAMLKANAALSLRYFRLSDKSVDNASLDLNVSGPLTDPRGDLELVAHQVQAGETTLSRVTLSAHAGMRDLSGKLRVEGRDRFVALDVLGKRRSDGSLLVDAGGTGHIQGKRLGLKLVELQIAQGAYSLRELSAFSGRERLSVMGALDAQQRLDASLSIQNVDLAPWAPLVLSDVLTGTLDASARAQGSLQAPVLRAHLSVRALHSARTPRAPPIDLKTKLVLDSPRHLASLELAAQSPDGRVLVDLKARAALSTRAGDLVQAFERASYAVQLDARSDVPFASQFAGDALTRLDGSLEAALRVRGTLEAPELDARVGAQLFPLGQAGARDRIELALALTPQRASSTLTVNDRHGELLAAKGDVQLPDGGPRALIADSQRLLSSPAKLSLSLAERRFDQLQGTLGQLAQQYGFALPVRVGAELSVESSGGALTASARAHAHAWAKGLDPQCGDTAELDATLTASLKDELLKVSLQALPNAGGKTSVELESKLSANSLLAGGVFVWGPASLHARGENLALHTFPSLCMLPPASTRFAVTADDVGKGPTRASVEVDVDEIRVGEEAPLGVHVRATSDAAAVQVAGNFKLGGATKGKFEARVPLAYAAGEPLPSVPRDKPLYAALSLPDFPLSGLTSFTRVVGRAGGYIKADLKLSGSLAAPQPAGFVELRDAAFSIAALAQPFSNVNGRFELSRDKLTIRSLKATDRSGKLAMKGYARYSAGQGGAARLYVSADKFPLRQQGSIVGELSTQAELEGKIDAANKLSLDLELREGRIWLTGKGGRQVQDLDEHPDVRYEAQRADVAAAAEEAAKGISLAQLRIRSERDLWLMHEDFSVQVGVDMRLRTDADGTTLSGQATLARGELNLLGKPFRIERGAVRFTGDVPPDPELDLKANHALRNGQTLTVQVLGRASAPQIVFSGAATNAGEAAMLLSGMSGGGAESKAQDDAANFAAGLTAGLLAVSARRRFGDWVPMLAVENNAAGTPSGARAGFDATRLIPKFMQGFARGMFVEGVVGGRSDTGSRSVGVGVRVEVALPRDFTTSMGYGPGTMWSTDVYWSP
jgi:autotransporter translocation and assembly factor TamB